jgi:hypothetical protein
MIDRLEDPRLDPYRSLKTAVSKRAGLFIAEGDKVVERLRRGFGRVGAGERAAVSSLGL